MVTSLRPRRPVGLGKEGRRLWRDMVERFDFAVHELHTLEGACREWDLIKRMEEELREASLVVPGSMGQDTANPLLQEIRQHRAEFLRHIKALNLPEEEAEPAKRSVLARKAAQARWGQRGAS